MKRTFAVFALLIASSACYHATINTGLQPSPQTIERPWAHAWLWGLVPPSTVEAMETCATGVARVETQHSVVNQLASFLTWGIYSPISIKVTCATGNDQEAAIGDALPMIDSSIDAHKALLQGEPFLVPLT
jgi:hypothetical protein